MSHHPKKKPIKILKKRSEFLRVAASNKSHVTKGMIVQNRVHTDLEKKLTKTRKIRLGFTVSKKVGKAVVRNRVKRRLKALAQSVFQEKNISDLDLVIIGRKNTVRRPFTKLREDMETVLEKINNTRSQK